MNPHEYQKPTLQQQSLLFLLGAIALVADQGSKIWIENTLNLGEKLFPFPTIGDYFNFFHVANPGMAFGLLQNGGAFLSVVAAVVSIGIIYYNTQLPADQRAARITLGFMLGGALGNATDRFRIGHVTDFINFNLRPLVADYPALDFRLLDWPIFNIADMCVVFGAFVLMYLMYLEEKRELKRQAETQLAVQADLQMTAAARKLPYVYNYEAGWSQEKEPSTAEPSAPANPKAQITFRALIVAATLALVATFIFLLSTPSQRRRRKRIQKREEQNQNG